MVVAHDTGIFFSAQASFVETPLSLGSPDDASSWSGSGYVLGAGILQKGRGVTSQDPRDCDPLIKEEIAKFPRCNSAKFSLWN